MGITLDIIGISNIVLGIFTLGVWFTRTYDDYIKNKRKDTLRWDD